MSTEHPCCKAHGPEASGLCNCSALWLVEVQQCEAIAAAVCQQCGNAMCPGGNECPENNLILVRDSRNSLSERLRRERVRLHDIRNRLLKHLSLPPTKGIHPTVEELLSQILGD